MSFASPLFLWGFMPAVLATYFIFPARLRNSILALASLLFYAYGAHNLVILLVAGIATNFVAGIAIEDAKTSKGRNLYLGLTIVFDLSILSYWKYAGFLTHQIHSLVNQFGGHGFPIIEVTLPVGISFFTFHLLSYVIDIWRGRSVALRQPLSFVTYIAMFPQLIAGPIVRYHEIDDQLHEIRKHRFTDLSAGFPRFMLGLSKKVVVADTVAPVASSLFFHHSGHLTTGSAWIGVIAFTIQIYFDFSGYSDMAIGLARMFGFRFPENFERPYSALSITDFWRRWHMSLSRWFRDYLYIPLGGNQGSPIQTYRNLIVVFILTGLWHGAAWTFLLWGLYHGGLLIWERRLPKYRLRDVTSESSQLGLWKVVWFRARAFLLVTIGWVLFRAPGLGQALHIFHSMFWPSGFGLTQDMSLVLSHQRQLILWFACLVVVLPRGFSMGKFLDEGRGRFAEGFRLAFVLAMIPITTILVAAGTFSPFLYYQF